MMLYFLGYMLMGLLVHMLMRFLHQRSLARAGETDILVSILDKEADWLDKWLLTPLVHVLMTAFWPVLLLARLWIAIKPEKPLPEEKPFSVQAEDLQQQLTITEIEQRHYISDPLGAVPALPFGHLHSAWLAFMEKLQPDDEIWSFDAVWENSWQRKEHLAGYVIRRDGVISDECFYTTIRALDSEST
ncbi:hypothetical protein [Oceanimonas sp. CAM02]|uniref:hypothetical protein n=1 Tax=Oceanimonas sp. CAM02 TaxID=3080336 RepID=UPI00293675CA|nr:hypothetical protein [Oceanimonas sp. CAM02]MDV2856304.1 hypothetical protein [Oceanimonas sp. CAM02]